MLFGKKKIKDSDLTENDYLLKVKGSIWGFIVGDALGVPVEFIDRDYLKKHTVSDMEEYGTHYQPKGTWSDDSSMVIATIDSLIKNSNEINYTDIMQNFLLWKTQGYFTPFGRVFDIGNATSFALNDYQFKVNRGQKDDYKCGNDSISSNGNGSLMRIIPIAIYLYQKQISYTTNKYYEIISNISSMTHAHNYSILACYIYAIFVDELLKCNDKLTVYSKVQNICSKIEIDGIDVYNKIIKQDISKLKDNNIKSSGYVVDTLEAVIWCFLTTNSYKDAVLKAVNLGDDTDTIAALVGGLAGLYYGFNSIPQGWINNIQQKDYLNNLINSYCHFIKREEENGR